MTKIGQFLSKLNTIGLNEGGALGYFYAYATDDQMNQEDSKRDKDEEKDDEIES